MAESTVVRVKRDGLITVSDSGAANSYNIACEAGDFTFDVPLEAINVYLDRGLLESCSGKPQIRKGDDQPMTLGFSAYLRDIGDTAGSYSTLPDILFQYASGTFDSSWTSTMGTDSDVETVTVQYTIDGTAFGEADKTLTFSYVVLRGSIAEGDPSTVSATGTSYTLKPTLA